MKSTVEKDFYTNVAVAWFSAGVIAPFLISGFDNIFTVALSVILSFTFLTIAKFYELKNI